MRALAVEIEGSLEVGGTGTAAGPRTLLFKADRVEEHDGGLRLTDFKTGKSISEGKQAKTRHDRFLHGVQAGERLQAVAYALAASRGSDSGAAPAADAAHASDVAYATDAAEGRYLFLKPELAHREFTATAGDRPFVDAFGAAVGTALAAWDAGVFVPRVVDPAGQKEPALCSWCAVAEACLRGDSGARRRLVDWTAARQAGGATGPGSAAESALLAVWRLPAKDREGGRER